MISFISGYTDTDIIYYCPACGAQIDTWHGDGTATCSECGMRFGVIEIDDGDGGEE